MQDKDYVDSLLQYKWIKLEYIYKRHLPTSQQNPEGLRASIKSAQLQQAIDALDEVRASTIISNEKALNSEEGLTVLVSLGFDPNAFHQARDGF